MSTVLQIVDTDDSTVLWDLTDTTGVANPYGVQGWFPVNGEVALASPDSNLVRFAYETRDGGRTVLNRRGFAGMSWRQRLVSTSYDNLAAGVGDLARLFARGGTLRWVPNGAAEARWIDFEPSDAPVLLDGREMGLYDAISRFDVPQGIPIVLTRQPYLRGPLLSSQTNLLTDTLMLRDTAIDNRPDGWTWDNTSGLSAESVSDPALAAYQFTLSTTSTVNLQQATALSTAAASDVWTFSVYVKGISVTTAKVRLAAQFRNGGGALIGSETTSTLVDVTSSWVRLTVTTAAAPATTDHILVSVRFQNTTAAANAIALRWGQAEKASAATLFVPGSDLMSNNPAGTLAGSTMPIWVQGNAPTSVALTLRSADVGSQIQEYLVARRADNSEPLLKEGVLYVNGSFTQCETLTLTADTTSVSDAGASGGLVADCAYTSNATIMQRRVRGSLAIDPDAVRGTWDVYLRAKAGAASVHVVQARWAASLANPAPNVNDEVTLDTSEATTFGYVYLKLGSIAIPYEYDILEGVTVEIWTRRTSGTGHLLMDFLTLVPVDDPDPSVTRILTPPQAEEEWLGSELTTPPASIGGDPTWLAGFQINDIVRFDTNHEAAGTPPNTGSAWPAGHHRVTFQLQPGTVSGTLTLQLRVINVTDSTLAVSRLISVVSGDPLLTDQTLEFDSVAGKSYQAQVGLTALTKGRVTVLGIVHETILFLGQNSGVYTDPETGMVAQITSDAEFFTRLESRGPVPVVCTPGLNVLYANAIDIPILGYDEGQSVLGRTWLTSIIYAPRYWA